MKRSATLLGNPVWNLIAFMIGLGLAWRLNWETRDLVWGLWLSSLVIGYLPIVIGILGGVNHTVINNHPMGWVIGLAGDYSFSHSSPSTLVDFTSSTRSFSRSSSRSRACRTSRSGRASMATCASRPLYWPWLIAAGIAERGMLAEAWRGTVPKQPGKAEPHPMAKAGFNPNRAYTNVIRMHLLLFFFAGVWFAGIEHFAIYAVVYAVYFFPWSFAKDWRAARKETAG